MKANPAIVAPIQATSALHEFLQEVRLFRARFDKEPPSFLTAPFEEQHDYLHIIRLQRKYKILEDVLAKCTQDGIKSSTLG